MSKIFVSHRGNDSDIAERLAEELRGLGHEVWLDIWEIKIGDSIVDKINQGLSGCEVFILCYSQHGVGTPWISREWMSILARKLEHDRVKFYPVKLTGGDPPAILADFKYIDLSDDWDNGIRALDEAL